MIVEDDILIKPLQKNPKHLSFAKKVSDLLDCSEANSIIDYKCDVNAQLYRLFDIDNQNQQHIRKVLASKE